MQNDLKDFVNSLPNVSTQSMFASVGAKSRNFLVATWVAYAWYQPNPVGRMHHLLILLQHSCKELQKKMSMCIACSIFVTFLQTRRMQLVHKLGRISNGLGQHFHPFDELLWLFRDNSTNFHTTSGGPRDCWNVSEQSQEVIKRMKMLPKPCGHFRELIRQMF